MKTMDQALEEAKGMTFEKFWVMMMESRAETDKQLDELRNAIKEQGKNIGGIHNSQGEITEELFSNNLWKKFNEMGFSFGCQSRRKLYTINNQYLTEVDFIYENGEYVMPVEVKTRLTTEFVNDHIKRIKKVRIYMDLHNDKRKLVGTVAGWVVPESIINYAHKKGLYVMKQANEDVVVVPSPPGFKAREW